MKYVVGGFIVTGFVLLFIATSHLDGGAPLEIVFRYALFAMVCFSIGGALGYRQGEK
jgi:hypothetical protein